MDSSRWNRIQEIFGKACNLESSQRDAYLTEACAGDTELRHEIDKLLDADSEDHRFLDASPEELLDDIEIETLSDVVELAPAKGPHLEPGTTLGGRYRIEAFVASGGMGQVYRALDLELNEALALKTLRPEISADPVALRAFKREVLLARSVTHPNVCRIFDMGFDEPTGLTYLTMEYLPGETLADRVKAAGSLEANDSLPLIRDLAAALDSAHRAGVIHRDFKTRNVMVSPTDDGDGDRAVITDFGLAVTVEDADAGFDGGSGDVTRRDDANRQVDANESPSDRRTGSASPSNSTEKRLVSASTGPSRIVGTPTYMSPEQICGGALGPASDLYSLGVVIFEMRTGRVPFRGSTAAEITKAHLTESPPSPNSLVTMSSAWEDTILRLLAKKPEDRFATAHHAVRSLEGHSEVLQAVSHSLPAERDAFVGRDDELRQLAALLEPALLEPATSKPAPLATDSSPVKDQRDSSRTTRLVTLQGTGGTGKTRLAQKYGWDSLLRWPGGVWFCDVSEAKTVLDIAALVARALDVPLGRQDPVIQLGHAIAGRGPCLLVIDNFEQVAEHAEATIGRWLDRATEARFLVTSRQRLHLTAETIHELPPLDPMTRGAELFEVRAWGHRPGFLVNASNREQIQKIVKRLDGLPLAIEMAASRLRDLNPSELESGLADRFRILEGVKTGRHSTMETTLDWSWDLLNLSEQSTMAQLSVFEGGFTLEAAEAVVSLDTNSATPTVLDVLQSLMDKSWLRASARLGAPRFEMYATVQDYAAAKLRAGTHADAARTADRHGMYFAGMCSADKLQGLSRHGGTKKLDALHLELDNLTAACLLSISKRNEAIATPCYGGVARVLRFQGPWAQSAQLGAKVLEITEDPHLRGRVLLELAYAERNAGDVEAAFAHYEEGLATVRTIPAARKLEGVLYNNRGNLFHTQGRLPEARKDYEEALAIHREVGDRISEGVALSNLGNWHKAQGRTEEALAHFELALAIHKDVGDRRSEGVMAANQGTLCMMQGRMTEARTHLEHGLAIAREINDRNSVGTLLNHLATLHQDQGRAEESRQHFEAALTTLREVGNRRFEGIVLGNLGNLNQDEGRMDESRTHLEAALAIHRETDNRRSAGIVLGNLGTLEKREGRNDQALKHLEAALDHHRQVGNRSFEGTALGDLGSLYADLYREDEARRCFEEGIAVLRSIKDEFYAGVVLCSLGELEHQLGDLDAARAILVEAETVAVKVDAEATSELAAAIDSLRERLEGGSANTDE